MGRYHVNTSCNKCKGYNRLSNESSTDGYIEEADTKCDECGFEDHWAYGFFESGAEMTSNCETYG